MKSLLGDKPIVNATQLLLINSTAPTLQGLRGVTQRKPEKKHLQGRAHDKKHQCVRLDGRCPSSKNGKKCDKELRIYNSNNRSSEATGPKSERTYAASGTSVTADLTGRDVLRWICNAGLSKSRSCMTTTTSHLSTYICPLRGPVLAGICVTDRIHLT